MKAASILRPARRAAGLSQRDLAIRAGISQATIARIETGATSPRVDTLEVLLRECGRTLSSEPVEPDVDRSVIRDLLRLTPGERVRRAVEEARRLEAFDEALRR